MASIETVGELVDKADNFLEYGNPDSAFARLDPAMRIEALTQGLVEIRDALRSFYIDETGENPWEE